MPTFQVTIVPNPTPAGGVAGQSAGTLPDQSSATHKTVLMSGASEAPALAALPAQAGKPLTPLVQVCP